MSLTQVTPPALEPVTLSEFKLQLGFGPMEDTDQLREQTLAEELRGFLRAGREHCENICARAFITQTWKLTLDHFPYFDGEYLSHRQMDIVLPLPTFQSLTAFTYIDGNGTVQDNKATGAWGYQIAPGSDRTNARVRPPLFQAWPLTLWEQPDAVALTFTCGFGSLPSEVPYAVKAAIKLQAEWLYNGAKGNPPEAINALLAPYTVSIV